MRGFDTSCREDDSSAVSHQDKGHFVAQAIYIDDFDEDDVDPQEDAQDFFTSEEFQKKYPTLASFSAAMKAPARDIVGRDYEISQLMAAMSRPELCNALLLAPPGSGKLLTLGTPLPTPSGWTTMGEVQPGDVVLGRDGKPVRVSYVSDVEETPVLYNVSLSDGQVITACADHQWLVASHSGREQAYPSTVAETQGRRARVQARRDALLALLDGDLDKFSTTAELLELMKNIEDLTWKKPVGLQTYLRKQGVPRRRVGREGEQSWKGGTRVTTVYMDEFETRAALKALSEQVFRRISWGDGGAVVEQVLTTQQMVDTGVLCENGKRRNFSIRLAEPLDLPEAQLRVDPYVLGAWLGDGSSADGTFTQSDFQADNETDSDMSHLIEQVRGAGYVARRRATCDKTIGTKGLQTDLRAIGVLGDKHIPISYLRASIEQRLALLQGLMDTDGSVGSEGACELTLSDDTLARDAQQLIRSLGIKVNRIESEAGYKDADGEYVACKPRHRMVFTTTKQVFRLPRKIAGLPLETRPTQGLLYISDIAPAPTEPGKCIQVENDDHVYLCGDGFVPTHNTALVQAAMLKDTDRIYLEIDLARMIAGLHSPDEMATKIKQLFDDAEKYSDNETSQDLVLFIDEFHQIVQLSAAAVEALKPVLAASGARGIRIIAATTFEEFHEHIAKNQPLVERLQRINVNPPDQDTTIKILHGMATRYGVGHKFVDSHLFEMIYEYTDRYMPASTQPRKSIKVLDAMVGWHRSPAKRDLNKALLADVLMESTNVNVAFRVDAVEMKAKLDKKVFSQNLATSVVAKRLQLCVADLHDKTKPMSSFLFTGPTGTGKTELTKQLAHMLFGHDQGHLIRFDMSEYANEDSLDLFRSELTKRVWDMGHAVLLFDEIEKAAGSVVRVMLQVLDDGRLSDDHGRQVSFLNTYIILTTNAGSEIYETIAKYNVDDTGSGEQLMSKMREIKRSITETQGDGKFPPELLGRIDAVVPFQPLSRPTQRKIVLNKLKQLVQEVLTKHGVRIKVDPKVLEYLIENKAEVESNAGGARDAIGKMTDEVTTNIAAFVNAHPKEKVIRVEVVGVMKSEDESLLISDASIRVFAAT